MEENRYITLLGDKPQASLVERFTMAAHVRSGAVGIAAATAFYYAWDSVSSLELTLGAVACMMFFSTLLQGETILFEKGAHYSVFPSDSLRTKAIDKKPSQRVSEKSRYEYAWPIFSGRMMYGSCALILSSGSILGLVAANSYPERAASIAAFFSCLAAPLVKSVKGLHRFNKLAKGEWAIVDMPTEKQKQKEKVPSHALSHPA